MDVRAVEAFTSVLALFAAALAATIVGGRVLRHRIVWVDQLLLAIEDAALWIGSLIAAIATAGSLYFSEVAGYTPCPLCWYQRIAMYPLAAILVVAAIRRDPAIRWYTAPLAAVGACISTYHYIIEWRPSLEVAACGIGSDSCTVVWFREFGFVTLPLMALCGFLAILALSTLRVTGPSR